MPSDPQRLRGREAPAAAAVLAALRDLRDEQVERVLAHVEAQRGQSPEAPMFARTVAGPLGKLDTPVKTWLDAGTADLLRRKAAARRQDASSAQRDCIYAWVHGKTYSLMVAEKALHDANAMDIREQMAGPFEGREFGGRGR